jgi:hypothetical protein
MEEVAYPRRWHLCANLHGIVFYNMGIFINTAAETPNFLSLFVFST